MRINPSVCCSWCNELFPRGSSSSKHHPRATPVLPQKSRLFAWGLQSLRSSLPCFSADRRALRRLTAKRGRRSWSPARRSPPLDRNQIANKKGWGRVIPGDPPLRETGPAPTACRSRSCKPHRRSTRWKLPAPPRPPTRPSISIALRALRRPRGDFPFP